MANIIKQLKTPDNVNNIFPRTVSSAVFMEDGENLNNALDSLKNAAQDIGEAASQTAIAETSKIIDNKLNGLGEFVVVMGAGSSASNTIALSTSWANVFSDGLCKAEGTTSTTAIDSSYYSVSSTGVVTVKKAGLYFIESQVYMYTGFTASDTTYAGISINNDDPPQYRLIQYKVPVASTYNGVPLVRMLYLQANDTITLKARNETGARGTVQRYASTHFSLTKIK